MTLDMRKEEPATVKLHIGAEKELEEEKAIAEIIEQPAIAIQQDIVIPLKEELATTTCGERTPNEFSKSYFLPIRLR